MGVEKCAHHERKQGRKTPVEPTPPATASIGSNAEVQVWAAGRWQLHSEMHNKQG